MRAAGRSANIDPRACFHMRVRRDELGQPCPHLAQLACLGDASQILTEEAAQNVALIALAGAASLLLLCANTACNSTNPASTLPTHLGKREAAVLRHKFGERCKPGGIRHHALFCHARAFIGHPLHQVLAQIVIAQEPASGRRDIAIGRGKTLRARITTPQQDRHITLRLQHLPRRPSRQGQSKGLWLGHPERVNAQIKKPGRHRLAFTLGLVFRHPHCAGQQARQLPSVMQARLHRVGPGHARGEALRLVCRVLPRQYRLTTKGDGVNGGLAVSAISPVSFLRSQRIGCSPEIKDRRVHLQHLDT